MKKKEIIEYAESLGFKLNYDKFEDKEYPGSSSNLRYLRFISKDESLDEKELRWIWYKDHTDEDNIAEGKYILSRLEKKKKVLDFLKY